MQPRPPAQFLQSVGAFRGRAVGMATGADFAVPGTVGKRPLISRILDPVVGRILTAGNDDPVVRDRIGEVINMLKPPSALLELPILRRALLATMRRIKRQPGSIPAMPPPAAEPAG